MRDKDDLIDAKDIDDVKLPSCHVVVPFDLDPGQVEYVVVQVSERRHAVAKYQGVAYHHGGLEDWDRPLAFGLISRPMSFDQASRLAERLKMMREQGKG